MSWRNTFLLWAVGSCAFGSASPDLGFEDDSDLTHFVSRPDIKAPLLDVKIYDDDAVEPGYFFLGPYAALMQPIYPPKLYQPCQTGPAIYDNFGNLVWSGACLVKNQNACDFRAFKSANGSTFLSTILFMYGEDRKGHGVVLDDAYNNVGEIHVPHELLSFNMHELNFMDGGRRALHIIYRPDYIDVTSLHMSDKRAGWVANLGFRELDVNSGKSVFDWWGLDHIDITESTAQVDDSIEGPYPKGWNWLHINSVDKNEDGDYIMSARFTDAIYKISGVDGSILWRLGGIKSSFHLDGFNFSRQHDARWLSYDDETEVISFLDNAADDRSTGNETNTISTAYIVQLNKKSNPWTATVVQKQSRPDGGLSRLRGNQLLLPGGNRFIGWSDNAYITEHKPDGTMVMEAQFRSKRFVTYRSYKFPFAARPQSNPDLKAFAYGTTPETITTVFYVSWNGATEVHLWKFHRNANDSRPPGLIGSTERTGFETVFQHSGLESFVFAEAVAADGSVLGRSDDFLVTGPSASISANGEGRIDSAKRLESRGIKKEL